jgi:osmotically-inducible protein OsmY
MKMSDGREQKMYSQSEDMRAGVLNALYWDLRVPRHHLSVDVENGWVTVSGTVDLPYQRTCAEFDARSVPGVVGVTNLIRLSDAQPTERRTDQVSESRH